MKHKLALILRGWADRMDPPAPTKPQPRGNYNIDTTATPGTWEIDYTRMAEATARALHQQRRR